MATYISGELPFVSVGVGLVMNHILRRGWSLVNIGGEVVELDG